MYKIQEESTSHTSENEDVKMPKISTILCTHDGGGGGGGGDGCGVQSIS